MGQRIQEIVNKSINRQPKTRPKYTKITQDVDEILDQQCMKSMQCLIYRLTFRKWILSPAHSLVNFGV